MGGVGSEVVERSRKELFWLVYLGAFGLDGRVDA